MSKARKSHHPVAEMFDSATHAAHGIQHLEEQLWGVDGVEDDLIDDSAWYWRGSWDIFFHYLFNSF